MASLAQWTQVRKLRERESDREAGMLQFMGLQRVGHNLVTEQQHELQSPSSV